MRKIIGKNPLYFSFLFPALMDGLVTILGQGRVYWQNPSIASDASPAYYFLVSSPYIFIIGSIVWFLFFYWVFLKLKEPFNLILMFVFIAGHSWGSTSWLMKIFKDINLYIIGNQPSIIFAWFLAILYFFLISLFATYCLKIYLKKNK